jgi:probable F420-dependent oxidoreductase
VQFGVHLPQYGRVASAEAITRAARHAEELGFVDVWVSDHIVHPAAQSYPSPFLLDPLVAMTWAAAATTTVRLGTSVLVLPQHNPLELANTLATIDFLSGGRVLVGGGVGWSEAEFDALGYGFADRGARTDEIVDLLRAAWTTDPTSFHGEHYDFADIRFLPKPAAPGGRIPVWIGGSSEPAFRRATAKGDGFQAVGIEPPDAARIAERIRRDRPDPAEFPFSVRTGWDPQGMDPDEIRRQRDEFEAAGVQHMVSAPWRSNLDDWLRSLDLLAELVDPRGGN